MKKAPVSKVAIAALIVCFLAGLLFIVLIAAFSHIQYRGSAVNRAWDIQYAHESVDALRELEIEIMSLRRATAASAGYASVRDAQELSAALDSRDAQRAHLNALNALALYEDLVNHNPLLCDAIRSERSALARDVRDWLNDYAGTLHIVQVRALSGDTDGARDAALQADAIARSLNSHVTRMRDSAQAEMWQMQNDSQAAAHRFVLSHIAITAIAIVALTLLTAGLLVAVIIVRPRISA
ncbi:MAG: hypothetical protein FWC70_09340 [Defluviitaleaceae bacterium]|nr:hypothetical protein [Defluviitaleaceae bacterium]